MPGSFDDIIREVLAMRRAHDPEDPDAEMWNYPKSTARVPETVMQDTPIQYLADPDVGDEVDAVVDPSKAIENRKYRRPEQIDQLSSSLEALIGGMEQRQRLGRQ